MFPGNHITKILTRTHRTPGQFIVMLSTTVIETPKLGGSLAVGRLYKRYAFKGKEA